MSKLSYSNLRRNYYKRSSFFSKVLKSIIRKFRLGSYTSRRAIDAVDRPHYSYIVWNAAHLAKQLGHKRISVIEFGVAGGNGLVNLEYHAQEVSKLFGIEIEIYGFDNGSGLPAPKDYRDLAYHWKEGHFEMDEELLRSRLKFAKVIIGNIEKTLDNFVEEHQPAPIGAISFDVDYYSSTVASFKIFENDLNCFLPRVFCYFDDTIGSNIELYNDYTGMRLAINEFNEANPMKKLAQPYNLITQKWAEVWQHQIWIGHLFDHKNYSTFISEEDQQLKLK